MLKQLWAAVWLGWAGWAWGAAPVQIQAAYTLALDGIEVAQMSETFSRNGEHYQLNSVSRAVGLLAAFRPETITVHSEGDITAQGLRPQQMLQQRERDAARNSAAVFDWANNQLTLTDRNGERRVELAAGSQDRLSAIYQFLFLDLRQLRELAFMMTDGHKLDRYDYQQQEGQQVEVPLGKFKAAYWVSPAQANGSKTEIWLAVERSNFPVKIVVTEANGSRYTQTLTQLVITP